MLPVGGQSPPLRRVFQLTYQRERLLVIDKAGTGGPGELIDLVVQDTDAFPEQVGRQVARLHDQPRLQLPFTERGSSPQSCPLIDISLLIHQPLRVCFPVVGVDLHHLIGHLLRHIVGGEDDMHGLAPKFFPLFVRKCPQSMDPHSCLPCIPLTLCMSAFKGF